MRLWSAVTAVALLYLLHQDFWFWREARPLVFGFLPIGLFYHAVFTIASSGALWLLVRFAWPAHLDDRATGLGTGPSTRGGAAPSTSLGTRDE